jgi:phosphate-selective porin OprO/OprP
LYLDPYAGERYLLHVGGGYNFSQIGGSGTTGAEARTFQARALPEFFVGDQAGGFVTAAGTPVFLDTGRILADNYQLLHGEIGGNYGPAHFQAEYLASFVDQRTGAGIFYDGAYVQCGYFLTGEHCGYNKQMGALDYNVQPFSDFFALGRKGCFGGWGAWEIAARWSYLNLADNNLLAANQLSAAAGPPASPNPGTLNSATLALNWWWNQYTRVQFNYIHPMLNSTAFGRSDTDIYATRFQIEF